MEINKEHATAIEEMGTLDIIEGLQSHSNNTIYEYAVTILEKYFNAEELDY